MSGSDLKAKKLSRQYAVFTLTPNMSNLTVISISRVNVLARDKNVQNDWSSTVNVVKLR